MNKIYTSKLFKHMLIPAVAVLCFILSVIAYTLPMENVRNNIKASLSDFSRYETYPRIYDRYLSSRLDNWTDAIMLMISSYNDDTSAVENAAASRYYRLDGGNPTKNIVMLYGPDADKLELGEYVRYWNGYNIVLRTLLEFFTYSDIKMLNTFVQLLLLSVLMYFFVKNNIRSYIFSFAAALFMTTPITLVLSMQYTWVAYTVEISMLMLLKYRRKIKETIGYFRFFALIGVIINYLDMLSVPLLTLGFPLVLLFVLEDIASIKQAVKLLFICCMGWVLGYAGMWIFKWLLGSVILHRNAVKDAVNTILLRSSNSENKDGMTVNFSRFDVLLKNLDMVSGKPYIAVFTAGVLHSLANVICKSKNAYATAPNPIKAAVFFVIALMPIVWYFVLSNHSYMHYWFTYKNIAIIVFALLCCIKNLPLSKKDKTI